MIKDKTSVEAPLVKAEEGHFTRIFVEEGSVANPAWIVGTETVISHYADPNAEIDLTSTNSRGIQLAAYAIPKGQITKIAVKNGSSGLSSTACYLAVYEEDPSESSGYRYVACSKKAVAQSTFGTTSYTEWEFEPDAIQLTGAATVRITFNSDRNALESYADYGQGSVAIALDSTNRSLVGSLTYSEASGGKWYQVTPQIMFTVLQNVVATGAPIFRTDKLLGSHFVAGVSLNEGILLSGNTCFAAEDEMYGIEEDYFINNIQRYDNVIPTVKMIRLMLQNQSRLATAAVVETPITPAPAVTTELPTVERPVIATLAAAPVVEVPVVTEPEVVAVETSDVKPVSTKKKNDRPRKRKKSN